MVGVALLRVSVVTSVSVALVACLGSRRVTVVVAVSRGVVGVLLVLRVGGVVLGVDGLLPDLFLRGKSGSGARSASDDATSDNCVRSASSSQVRLAYEEGSADKGVGATEVHEQVRLDVSDGNTCGSIVGFIGNQASCGVSVWVDDTVPLFSQRVEDFTKSRSFFIAVIRNVAVKNTIRVLNITSSVDVKCHDTILVI